MMQITLQNILRNLKNIPGWRTNRKIVVIECDDWGGIRMPSKNVYDNLLGRGLRVATGWFNKYDTLETENDLEYLFDALSSVKDTDGNFAVMTAVANVANPDFDKIRSSGFSEYHYEPFTKTLKRYYQGEDVFKLWREGMTAGIFVPELHGREHISVQLWLEKLREGDKDLLIAFDQGFTSLDVQGVPLPAKEFRAEFFFTSEDQKPFLLNSIKEGVSLFREIFGYLPRIFVPGNGIFHTEFEAVVATSGVKFLYVDRSIRYPASEGILKNRHLIVGRQGPSGITYYSRNCAFEPADSSYKGIDVTLKQVASAFRWGKPANISTHRVNFAGGIEQANREKGLTELMKLLKAIVQKWPEVEFMGSGDALEYMKSTN